LYASDAEWELGLKKLEKQITGYDKFRGQLGRGAATLAACIKFDSSVEQLGERLGCYAHLKATEDQANSDYQRMVGRFQSVATRLAQAASFIRPEIMAIPSARMKTFLAAKEMKPYRLLMDRILRYKKHTLGKKEEELLALQGEMAQAASKAFRQLLDADLKFGDVKNERN
jgi:oligoendopeptidase F